MDKHISKKHTTLILAILYSSLFAGLLWGLAHAPLIYFGFNYGEDYWGAPWSGMLLMTLVCVVLGTWLVSLTMRSGSIIPGCIALSAANVIGELPVLVSSLSVCPLLGLNPTGMIGMTGLLGGAILLLIKLPPRPFSILKNQ